MKRTIINFLIVISFFACLIFFIIYIKGKDSALERLSSVEKEARIISINDTECIVCFTDDNNEVEISIPVSQLGKSDKYEPGDYLLIEYSGDILETSPARIKDIISIEWKSR